ncbi:CpaD family pilus assembly protein [Sphingomonas oligophenolica]|uniref:Pilus assembly protein CpaD n=1 Tax=Sphingomonas oligophenolica TaxID=301154 RepID=A0A502CLU7_9SPHN|nr:CpaD family pilus assembly protein [Sphingomonas oligophenolica]TPG13732.1 pilus assembly protein CpaD [Sphingomonas oligophenolica]
MIKHKLLLAALAPTMAIGGCMGTENRGLESVHQPVIARTDYAIDLAVRGGTLATGERQRLTGWMNVMKLGFGDRISIDDPAYEGPGARGDVAAVVASYGLLLAEEPPVAAAPITPGTIRVVVSRMRASVPGCPDYSRDSSHEFNGNASSNYGCATNSTLAAMIARPEDLVRGRAADSSLDPATSTKAIDAYRKATPTGNGNTVKTESAKGN